MASVGTKFRHRVCTLLIFCALQVRFKETSFHSKGNRKFGWRDQFDSLLWDQDGTLSAASRAFRVRTRVRWRCGYYSGGLASC